MRELLRLPVLWASALLSIALLLSVSIFCRSWVRVRSGEELIRVVGSARKSIRSDFIIWSGTISRQGPDIPALYKALKSDEAKAKAYMLGKGVPEKEIIPQATQMETLYTRVALNPNLETDDESNYVQKVSGYSLSETIEVRSDKVDLVAAVSRESTELISQGLRFKSEAPMYLYTKLSDLKVTMQADAAADARARAEKIATNGGARLGALRYSRMSTPQIIPLYAAQEDDGGSDDTSSLEKKIIAVVSAGYGIG